MTSWSRDDACHSTNETDLMDTFGRRVDYLRISLTQRCNHSCFFCHREGEDNPETELTPSEIEKLVMVARRLGIHRVKLTGGEPLLRNDIIEIVRRISPLIDDLSLTTNGSHLERLASELKKAGLDRVNVSLHTLNPDIYRQITRTSNLEQVKRGIKRAIDVGLTPVKINVTVLSGMNDTELEDMIEYAGRIGAILQIIELQHVPGDNDDLWNEYWRDLKPLEEELVASTDDHTTRDLHARRKFVVNTNGNKAEVEVVRPTRNADFCSHCTRLRITSDGKLKPCLLRDDNLVDIQPYLTELSSDDTLQSIFKEVVNQREPYWMER